MILLVRATIPGQYERRPKCVRLVSYHKPSGIPKLLLSGASSDFENSATSTRQQRPHVKVATGAKPDGDHGGKGQRKQVDGTPQEDIHYGEEAEAVTVGEDHEEKIDKTLVNAAKVIQDAYRRHLERKRTPAVRKIQAAYRQYLKRKSARKGVNATQVQYWDLLRKRSTEMKWTKDSQHYLLFRVPLAYILVSLDVIKTFAESGKKEAKKRLMTADHKGIEEEMESINQYGYDNVNCILY